jgi:hypothetical protein
MNTVLDGSLTASISSFMCPKHGGFVFSATGKFRGWRLLPAAC